MLTSDSNITKPSLGVLLAELLRGGGVLTSDVNITKPGYGLLLAASNR